MIVGTNGIVVDNKGRILLVRREEVRAWAIPGGPLNKVELPTSAVSRLVEEETGIRVAAARLVGIYYWQLAAEDFLVFAFRCLIEGGQMTPSGEPPNVGFSPRSSLPRNFLDLHRERLERGLAHRGGTAYWGRQQPSRYLSIWRWIAGRLAFGRKKIRGPKKSQPPYQPPVRWKTASFVVIRDSAGDVLWVKRTDADIWNLPGGGSETGESPWDTAVRETLEETGLEVRLTACSGVYVKPVEHTMIFVFTGEISAGALRKSPESSDFAYFTPGDEPANALVRHIERVVDAFPMDGLTQFRIH